MDKMSSTGRRPVGLDTSVAPVEEFLEAAASSASGEVSRRNGRLVATHAVWLCACEASDESPCWLIYTVDHDGIGWQRLPDGADVADVIDAEHLTGGHTQPPRLS